MVYFLSGWVHTEIAFFFGFKIPYPKPKIVGSITSLLMAGWKRVDQKT